MKRLAKPVLILALATAGCTPPGSGTLGPMPSAPIPSTSHGAEPTIAPSLAVQPSGLITVQVWLTRNGRVFLTYRTRPATITTSRLALTELIKGPEGWETGVGVTSAVPGNTTFDIKGISDGVATVNFSSGMYADGPDQRRLRQAQVVYTLTQFSTVSRVEFQLSGGSYGPPVGRAAYADLLPRILVSHPAIGQRITSPVTVTGTADVREATVNVRVLDASGREIATRFTTATCGSGCRGDYTITVPYKQCAEQRGTVEVFEVSGEDGTRVSTVLIPVTLAAC